VCVNPWFDGYNLLTNSSHCLISYPRLTKSEEEQYETSHLQTADILNNAIIRNGSKAEHGC
jgi:hypothetical protein